MPAVALLLCFVFLENVMSNTEVADYTFTIKESRPSADKDDDGIWLLCEPKTNELSIVQKGGFLGVRLKPGARIAEAQEVARYLRDHVAGFSFTTP